MRDNKRGTIEDRATDALLSGKLPSGHIGSLIVRDESHEPEAPGDFVLLAENKLKSQGAKFALELLRDMLREIGDPAWTTKDVCDIIDNIVPKFDTDPVLNGSRV